MLVLGISGGMNLVYEDHYPVSRGSFHDAAAALVDDGRIVAAIEEERLNRIKHTNKAPAAAIRFCLDSAKVSLNDVDRVAFFGTEGFLNGFLKRHHLHHRQSDFTDARGLIRRIFNEELGFTIADDKMTFVHHHMAHAVSAFALSGFEQSLILTIDGHGDGIAGMLLQAEGPHLSVINTIPTSKSLGWFYDDVIRYLGFEEFEEYKVMGLAPYGDPGRFRDLFKTFYSLMPNGGYALHKERLEALYDVVPPRKKAEAITQLHMDVAAALQESLEEIVLHLLRYFRRKTGQRNLCLAGGVAHNCSLNGKILYSGLFSDVFVQPAAHDAGTAIGAALQVYRENHPAGKARRLEHVYLGTDVGDDALIAATLWPWRRLIEYERVDHIAARAAALLADGAIIGWVQGRSEFGPRALGNRSIVADPRPAQNKDIINAMVKKREGFRPFAPSVLEECAGDYFDLPAGQARLPFMVFVVRVRKDKQALLGAVTHVDGSARVHTVSKATNEPFWNLINEFGKLTGVPVLLNTSFNNNVEPIVDSAQDAVVCFLTTSLHYLVVGNYLVRRREHDYLAYLDMIPSMPLYTRMQQVKGYVSSNQTRTACKISNTYDQRFQIEVSPEVFSVLSSADGKASLGRLLDRHGSGDGKKAQVDEIIRLWTKRVVKLSPPARR
ncbi:MAG TPA: carbamoyltransferase C-terminal domain-containing protein [Blastocatellia bacterium]|nr:carbamoyltransferase C-terminal domain-containing protein [Blastocatellia bacterium]